MKILKQFETKSDSKQILSWLCWIKYTCGNQADCRFCPLKGYPEKGILCRVRNIYREIYPDVVNPKFPDEWRSLPAVDSGIELAPLDFLYEIKWDESGDPIPELKEEF